MEEIRDIIETYTHILITKKKKKNYFFCIIPLLIYF